MTASRIWGYLNERGEVAVDLIFEHAVPFHHERARICQDGKVGYIDPQGRMVIAPQFNPDGSRSFVEGFAAVQTKTGKYGYINKAGEMVIPVRFDFASHFSNGLACVRVGELHGLIDKRGVFAIEPKYECMGDFSDGLVWVTQEDNSDFYVNSAGMKVLGPFERTYDFHENVATVKLDGAWCILHRDGSQVKVADVDYLHNCHEDMIGFIQDGQEGYMNPQGRVLIEPAYEDAGSFQEGLAYVKLNERYGVIDREGRMVIPPKFDRISVFYGGIACARLDDKTQFIKKDGTVVLETSYRAIYPFRYGLTPAYAVP